MAFTVTVVLQGLDAFVADVEVGTDTDTVVDLVHGLPEAPLSVTLAPLTPSFYVSNWNISISDTIIKLTRAGNLPLGASPEVRVVALVPQARVLG